MRIPLVLSLVLLLSLCCDLTIAQRKKDSDTKKQAKAIDNGIARMTSVGTLMQDNLELITLNDGNFSKFVIERPRMYHAVIMLTATDKRYQCGICIKAKEVFAEVANHYRTQFDFNGVNISQKMAFFVMEPDDSRSTFQDLSIETVPRIYVLPPREVTDSKLSMADFEISVRVTMEGAQAVINEIERISHLKIVITMDPVPLMLALGVVAVLLSLLVSAASLNVQQALLWYRSPRIWVVVSLVCFSVGVSGSIFCVIRSAPMYGMSHQGLRIFAGQGRDQYLLEGVIVAALTVGCAAALMICYWSTKLHRFYLVRHVGVIAGMSLFVVCGLQIWDAYVDKTRWYSLKDTLPPELWTWLSSSVKKTSGFLKRIVRLCEFWMFECKDREGLTKKAKQLFVEYFKRELENLVAFIKDFSLHKASV